MSATIKADGLFIGPADLPASMGLPGDMNNTKVQELFDRGARFCNRIGKSIGIVAGTLDWQRATIAEIGTAIERLRLRYKPNAVIIVSHSGGAAITAVLLGMKPQLADAAILVACPCDLAAWRAGRSRMPWSSENPMQWVEKVSPATKVIALTGSRDDTTVPALGKPYVEGLQARGIDAIFQLVPHAGHIDMVGSTAVSDATFRLLRR
jgi:predicted alpha/beta hydrolase family esterase